MGELIEDVFTILLGIIFYILTILSIVGVGYSYLKSFSFSAAVITNIEISANANAITKVIVLVLNYSKYIVIPVLIWGLIWYNSYASRVI